MCVILNLICCTLHCPPFALSFLSPFHPPDKIFLFGVYSLTGGIEKSKTRERKIVVVLDNRVFLHCLFGMKGKRYGLFIGVWQREVFLEGIGGEFLAHVRSVEHAARSVVDEGDSVDATLVGKTQHRVDTLAFEQANKFVLVISLSKCLKYCPFGRLGEFLFGYLFLR